MSILTYILLFNLIGSIVSLSGGMLLFLIKKSRIHKTSHLLSSFAAGTLLGTAFFDLFPEALEEAERQNIASTTVFMWVLGGILFFFLLERLIHYFHHHEYSKTEIEGKPIVPLIIIGDTLHNFIDGIAIAATFLISVPLGIVTAFAVGAHEIPQEIGDFGILLKSGLKKRKILAVNLLSALASFAGALLMFFLGEAIEGLSIIFLALSAGLFLYIALSDIIPEIHKENKKGWAMQEILFLLAGVVVVYIAITIIEGAVG